MAQVYEAADGAEALLKLANLPHPRLVIVASSKDSTLISSVETMTQALGLPLLAALQKPLTEEQLRAALLRHRDTPGHYTPVTSPAPVASIAELAGAIVAQKISVHFQPKVDMKTGMIKGVEALARWQHPEHGWIPPVQFIPLAESHGLVHDLTLEVARQSFEQAAIWNARGLKLSVAVNLSPLLLNRPEFVTEVAELLNAHRLAAEQIVWEVTESSIVADLGMSLGTLARLRLKGFGLSIDDYGTGFASMQQLSRIPFTELKVDRSFVHGAHQREHLRVILQSALEMANRLKLTTVAEGVETMEDWRLLQASSCALGQGYLIARPMAGDALPGWLREHNARLAELRA